MNAIVEFQGSWRWLSNFHICDIEYEGIVYPSTEHAYQASKTLDIEDRRRIAAEPWPGTAKRMGKNVVLRPGFDWMKSGIMLELNRQKYTRHLHLGFLLVATKDVTLVEGNDWHDQYWGVCTCPQHNGTGQNWLGRILMQVRTELRRGQNGARTGA